MALTVETKDRKINPSISPRGRHLTPHRNSYLGSSCRNFGSSARKRKKLFEWLAITIGIALLAVLFSSSLVLAEAPHGWNGETATIWVNTDGIIQGGPDAGQQYVGTLRGTAGRDVIVGTDGADEIYGRGGDDIICGRGGNDDIEGGPGSDWIHGGAGADDIDGNGGNDRIWGGPGNDDIDGGYGNDTIFGGPGNDELDGEEGDDCVAGDSGHDECEGDDMTATI